MKLSVTEIAGRLGRHRSTIYRELSRNHTEWHYRPGLAHFKAQKRYPKKPSKLQTNLVLYHYVYDRLRQGWSPEQISGRMRLEKQPFFICHESIYRYIYTTAGNLLHQYLPKKKRRRKRCRSRQNHRCRYGDIRLITKRPISIEKRSRLGHWEGDLIAFKGKRTKTVTTLVERKSRMLTLIKNTSKVSNYVMSNIKENFNKRRHLICKTITFDQGGEFANYWLIERAVPCKVYYCEKRSPWQKGSNENMNGRLRRYLPKDADIDQVEQKDLDVLANKMNTLPRKCLGYQTPLEVYSKCFGKGCRARS